MVFRVAVYKDIDGITDMVSRIIKGPNTVWDEEYPTRRFFEETLGYKGLYVAEECGKIVGTMGVQPVEDIFADLPCWTPAKNACEGVRLGFDPDYQGKHLAIPFQKFCLADCASRLHYDAFRFTVSKDNPRAIHVYDRFGYKRVGEVNWLDMDWYCYECPLPFRG